VTKLTTYLLAKKCSLCFSSISKDIYLPIPEVRAISPAIVERNYLQIKQDIRDIIRLEMERLLSDPTLSHFIVKKN